LAAIHWMVRRILAVAGFKIGENEPMLSPQEELRGAVDLLHREGDVTKHDRDMLGGLLDLPDLMVADVMIHRTQVVMVDAGLPPEQAVEAGPGGPGTPRAPCRDHAETD